MSNKRVAVGITILASPFIFWEIVGFLNESTRWIALGLLIPISVVITTFVGMYFISTEKKS